MMSDCLSTDETLSIETTVVTLRSGQPVLNGRPLEELYFVGREPIRDAPIQLPS